MLLDEFVVLNSDFGGRSHAEKVRLLVWYLHTYRGKEFVSASEVRECFDKLHVPPPTSISSFLHALVGQKPPQAIKKGSTFKLTQVARTPFDKKYVQRASTIEVHALLTALPGRLNDVSERQYLDEALICFRYGAFRGAIVMTWNLAFDHLCNRVMARHLASFNASLSASFPKKTQIVKRDDFDDLKEAEVLQVCKSARVLTGNQHKVFKDKLDLRNIAAHPSGNSIPQLTAEYFITDLVTNGVLTLS